MGAGVIKCPDCAGDKMVKDNLTEKLKVENKLMQKQIAKVSIKQNINALKEAISAAEMEPGISHALYERFQQWGTLIFHIDNSADKLIED